MSAPIELQPGSVFAHDFRIVRPLAEGGMGAVYVVEQLSTGKERALKVMHPQLVRDARNRERFAQEARLGARLESDHVVEVLAAGVDVATGVPWLAMELLRGETLNRFVERRGRLGGTDAREVLVQLLHAMVAAHRASLVHRDLKPENLFVSNARRSEVPFTLKVLDFGIAKLVAENRTAVTATSAIGSPLWMAPEQADAAGQLTASTDVWALGLIAFYVLTGRPFWFAGNVEHVKVHALMAEILLQPIAPASARAADLGLPAAVIPPGFDAWFARCVARDPAGRFRDASAALAALPAIADGSSPGAAVPSRAAPLPTLDVAGDTLPAHDSGPVDTRRTPVPATQRMVGTGPGYSTVEPSLVPRPPARRWPLWASLGGGAAAIAVIAVALGGRARSRSAVGSAATSAAGPVAASAAASPARDAPDAAAASVAARALPVANAPVPAAVPDAATPASARLLLAVGTIENRSSDRTPALSDAAREGVLNVFRARREVTPHLGDLASGAAAARLYHLQAHSIGIQINAIEPRPDAVRVAVNAVVSSLPGAMLEFQTSSALTMTAATGTAGERAELVRRAVESCVQRAVNQLLSTTP